MDHAAISLRKLMQHTMVAVSRALPAIPESRVVPFARQVVEQRCAQHVLGQAQQSSKFFEIERASQRDHPRERINVGADQTHQPLSWQAIGAGEFPQDRDEGLAGDKPIALEPVAQRSSGLQIVQCQNRKARCLGRFTATLLRVRVRLHGETGYSRSAVLRGTTKLAPGSNRAHP